LGKPVVFSFHKEYIMSLEDKPKSEPKYPAPLLTKSGKVDKRRKDPAVVAVKKSPVTIKRRPGSPKLDPDAVSKNLQAVGLFGEGKTVEEIEALIGWEAKSVRSAINKHFLNLKGLLETEALVASQRADGKMVNLHTKTALNTFKNQRKIDANISADFMSKLSEPGDVILTNEEVMFCYLIVHEGDAMKALEDSDLAEGLVKSHSGYNRACKLRILMLKGKINIIKYINTLQIDYAKELNVNKDVIQTTIMRQLAKLEAQDDPRNSSTIAKLTEQLGRTVGAFSDRVIVEEVSFDDAMDRMMDMRKEYNKEKGITGETYVYDPKAII
jgi:hypothetical protein